MEEARCCLCRQSVAEASALVKRKLFHGKACESSKKLINELLMENLKLSVQSLKEMNDSHAYLCHKCHGQTSKYLKLLEEAKKIKENLLSMALNLTTLPVANRKRTSSTRDSGSSCPSPQMSESEPSFPVTSRNTVASSNATVSPSVAVS